MDIIKSNKPESVDTGYFIIQLEIDEKLFGELVGTQGKLKLGSSKILLQGGGIVGEVKKKIKESMDAGVILKDDSI